MNNDRYGILLGIMVLSLVVLPVVFSISSFDDNGQSIITATQPYHTFMVEN